MSDLLFTARQSITSAIRTDILSGKEYLVVPVIAIVEGVLNGEYVPAEELSYSAQAWSGRPITIGHPERNGRLVSAGARDMIEQFCAGYLLNTYFDNNRIKGEMWVDASSRAVQNENGNLAQALRSGVEVSTAYFRTLDNRPGEFGGVEYYGIARKLLPDHLAILLNEQGACSWQDGCGAPRVNKEGDKMGKNMKTNRLSTARTPSYSGTEETSWAEVGKSFADYLAGYYKHTGADEPEGAITSVADAPQAAKDWIASKTLIGDPSADTTEDLISFPVVNPGTDNLNRAALGNASARASSGDISEDTVTSIQNKVTSLLEDEFSEPEAQQKRSVVREFFSAMTTPEFWQGKWSFNTTGDTENVTWSPSSTTGNTDTHILSNELSFDDRVDMVRSAFYDKIRMSPDYDNMWVRAVYEDFIIVEASSGFLKYGYSTDEEGAISFAEPIAVEIVYQPVGVTAQQQQTNEREGTMDEKQIENLAEKYKVKANDLQSVPEVVLEAMETQLATNRAEPCDKYKALIEFADSNGGAEVALHELQANKQQREKEKKDLIDSLAGNSEFTEDELQSFNVEQLKKLEAMRAPAKTADYSGIPVANVSGSGEQVVELSPMGA